jgi:hypothetical protein
VHSKYNSWNPVVLLIYSYSTCISSSEVSLIHLTSANHSLKIYRTISALSKVTRIPMIRWSFPQAGFCLSMVNLFAPPDVILAGA